MTVDFGFYAPTATLVSLGNLVWHDRNNNGQVDPDENGIDGVEVQLYAVGDALNIGTPTAVDTTKNGGFYRFDNLAPGPYAVYIPEPPALYPTSTRPRTSMTMEK